MFRDDGSLALIDFGLAKQMRLHAAITGTGQIFGTPYYMSPEQGHAEPTDERSDLYSLGCIFYEMLTGERPFTASSPMGVIYRHAHAPRPRLARALTHFQPVLDRLLAVDRFERYQSAGELLAALDAQAAGRRRAAPSAAARARSPRPSSARCWGRGTRRRGRSAPPAGRRDRNGARRGDACGRATAA